MRRRYTKSSIRPKAGDSHFSPQCFDRAVPVISLTWESVCDRRDEPALRLLSLGRALTSGLAVCKCSPRLSSSWELVRWNEEPKLMWARCQALDLEETRQVAQVCVRFDSQQVSQVFPSTLFSLMGCRWLWAGVRRKGLMVG